MQSHISLSICAYAVCRISNSRNPAEAFPLGNSSSLILFPDFISGGTLPILFHSIQYIYPDTGFTLDSTSTPTFRGGIREVFFSVPPTRLNLTKGLKINPEVFLRSCYSFVCAVTLGISRTRFLFKGGRVVTAPKLGYQFLCCYSLLALIFKIFSWVCWMTLRKFCHFQPFKILLMSFSVGKTSFASAQFLLNPNSKFLEFGYALVITKEPPFSLFCWSSQLIPEIILSFLTLDMQKYC